MNDICPACHRVIGVTRFGVRLTALKGAIIDKIKAAGEVGISSQELIYALWSPEAVNVDTVKSHVWQINSLLQETDWRIHSDRRRWFLTRERS